jgi:hypothetical protein
MIRTFKWAFFNSLAVVSILIVLGTSAPQLMAIPAFARKYHTACATCHSNWPELNDFGRAFKLNGFKFPKDDEDFLKEPPLMLGAEAQKEAFPHAIYPGELPILPIAFRYSGAFSYNSPLPSAVGYTPNTDLFEPNTLTIIGAGSLGPSVAFWFDNDLNAGGSGANGGLGDGWIKANNFLGYLLHVPKNDLNVRYGQFELDLPWSQARTINLTNYAIWAETANVNPSGSGPLPGTTNNPFSLASPQKGIEIGGYPNRGYTWWSIAAVNGQNSSYGSSFSPVGQDSKDVYVNLGQRFDLERDPEVRKDVQASGPTGIHDHTSIRFNAYGYYGVNELNHAGAQFAGLPVIREPFYRLGGAVTYKFRSNFEIWGLYQHARDSNKALNGDSTGFVSITPVTYSGGFVEAEYWFYPWLIGMMRYDGVNSPTDRINGVSRYDTRSTYSPALQILVRPNIKLETQYTFNYEQPVPGATTFYRSNQFLTGADFVF